MCSPVTGGYILRDDEVVNKFSKPQSLSARRGPFVNAIFGVQQNSVYTGLFYLWSVQKDFFVKLLA